MPFERNFSIRQHCFKRSSVVESQSWSRAEQDANNEKFPTHFRDLYDY